MTLVDYEIMQKFNKEFEEKCRSYLTKERTGWDIANYLTSKVTKCYVFIHWVAYGEQREFSGKIQIPVGEFFGETFTCLDCGKVINPEEIYYVDDGETGEVCRECWDDYVDYRMNV